MEVKYEAELSHTRKNTPLLNTGTLPGKDRGKSHEEKKKEEKKKRRKMMKMMKKKEEEERRRKKD